MAAVRLLVGLGNPGPRYEATRHNVGEIFLRRLAGRCGISMRAESRFKGELGRGTVAGRDLRLLVPTTFMNLSGDAVGAVARYYQIAPEEILVAYDEMAFEPGVVRLRAGGGANGHNGLKSIIEGLGNEKGFLRLRIGVGHPGSKDRVTAYLTSVRMPASEREALEDVCDEIERVLEPLLAGELQTAMNTLHAPAPGADAEQPQDNRGT